MFQTQFKRSGSVSNRFRLGHARFEVVKGESGMRWLYFTPACCISLWLAVFHSGWLYFIPLGLEYKRAQVFLLLFRLHF